MIVFGTCWLHSVLLQSVAQVLTLLGLMRQSVHKGFSEVMGIFPISSPRGCELPVCLQLSKLIRQYN